MEKGNQYGKDVDVVTTNLEEECEREHTTEREVVREQEVEIPRQDPYDPVRAIQWVECVSSVKGPTELPPEARVSSLASVINEQHRYPIEWSEIDWARFGIFVTHNFIETVVKCKSAGGGVVEDLSHYMRPVDTIVLWKTCQCLLVCEWEADKILGELWKASEDSCDAGNAVLASVSYLRKASDNKWKFPPQLVTPRDIIQFSSTTVKKRLDRMLVGLDLFAGHTTFGPRKKMLKNILRTVKAKEVVLQIPRVRGRAQFVARSDLDDVCTV